MKNLIVYVFLGALLASCAKKNEPVPRVPNDCIVREFKYTESSHSNLVKTAKVIYKAKNYLFEYLLDSIVNVDEKGNYIKTLVSRKFNENNFLFEETIFDRRYSYTIDSGKYTNAKEYNQDNVLLREFSYKYNYDLNSRFDKPDSIFITEENIKDTIVLFYNLNGIYYFGFPIKITRSANKIRYYRFLDKNFNIIQQSYAQYENSDALDTLEKAELIYNKNFDNKILSYYSRSNFDIQKYILGLDLQNILHTKLNGNFELGHGLYIPLLPPLNYGVNWENGLNTNERGLLKSYSGGRLGFYNISEINYSCY